MAFSIVAHTSDEPLASTAITKSSTCSRDIFVGTAEALVAAGHLTMDDLIPQAGRPLGVTAFLGDGQPCPLHRRAGREPGYKAVRQLNDGTVRVEVTVQKDVRSWRRRQQASAEYEAEQNRINKELAENGHKYSNWQLRHEYDNHYSWAESWEGTKVQLQGEGLGVGMAFPGEPGAPGEIRCKCPLGFDVRIYSPTHEPAKAAAGIYRAVSEYVPTERHPDQYLAFAPGVQKKLWNAKGWCDRDIFTGTSDALVAAKLIPSLHLFPGLPGRNKQRASYRTDWTPSTSSSNGRERWAATIIKSGKNFIVELAVGEDEEKRRREIQAAQRDEAKRMGAVLAQERRELRTLSGGRANTVETFRRERAEELETWANLLWKMVFGNQKGSLSFDIPEGSDLHTDIADAFQSLRDAVHDADVKLDKTLEAKVQARLSLTAARNDRGVQSVLEKARHLRLVHGAPEDGEG